MPTYEYVCDTCMECWETIKSMKDDSVEVCEKCGKEARKLFNSPLVKYNCSGFHCTDYVSDGPKYKDKASHDFMKKMRTIGGKEYRRRKRIAQGLNPNR